MSKIKDIFLSIRPQIKNDPIPGTVLTYKQFSITSSDNKFYLYDRNKQIARASTLDLARALLAEVSSS